MEKQELNKAIYDFLKSVEIREKYIYSYRYEKQIELVRLLNWFAQDLSRLDNNDFKISSASKTNK